MTEEDVVPPSTMATRSRPIKSAPIIKASASPARLGLLRVTETNTPLAAVAEQPFKLTTIHWRGDDENVADACQHQSRQRIINHRLVIDRQQLFAHASRDRIKPRSAASREYDSLQHARDPLGRTGNTLRKQTAPSLASWFGRRVIFELNVAFRAARAAFRHTH